MNKPNDDDRRKATTVVNAYLPVDDCARDGLIESFALYIADTRTAADDLGAAIARAATKVGIIKGDQSLTGPQLIMLCDDLATNCIAAYAKGRTDAVVGVRHVVEETLKRSDCSVRKVLEAIDAYGAKKGVE